MYCVSVSYIITAQTFQATVSASPVNAIIGDSVTLHCRFTFDDQPSKSCESVNLYWCTEEIWEGDDIWWINTLRYINQAIDNYSTKLTGSSASLDALNSDGHEITFTSIKEEDSGKYYCQVTCQIGGRSHGDFSPVIEITVKRKYNLYHTSKMNKKNE